MQGLQKLNLRCEISSGMFPAVAGLDVFPVVLFVGSDKMTGDSLAPICGSILKKMNPPCFIYGDVENPVNAKNLLATVDFIKGMHPQNKILVVDASVGVCADVGKIKFLCHGIVPGKAVGREFSPVGDFAIAGIVAFRNQQSGGISPVRLCHVLQMAKEIAREISLCARTFKSQPRFSNKSISLAGVYK